MPERGEARPDYRIIGRSAGSEEADHRHRLLLRGLRRVLTLRPQSLPNRGASWPRLPLRCRIMSREPFRSCLMRPILIADLDRINHQRRDSGRSNELAASLIRRPGASLGSRTAGSGIGAERKLILDIPSFRLCLKMDPKPSKVARAALGWGVRDPAGAAKVASNTISRLGRATSFTFAACFACSIRCAASGECGARRRRSIPYRDGFDGLTITRQL